ncbi:DUF4391 domain-containing protein [Maridesulfovibrio ferrireducens]|uniref:DUF4391 domain-containing protein n=1 Tax=Maridesulfovibrio ferrireducens TaxID=246191 RepID=UPI001A2775BB|nr:DUF4391 domain-containing protein [Maridesulfovibrio ferrireducens]MBI9112378.1 DUF4391 domain-containing protein [Maridesulfovibrio ferrireducens]
MAFLYNFPKQTFVGSPLPKSKIYKLAGVSSKVQKMFVREVEKITWSYKLAPETINLPASESVQEIQIFTVALRTEKLNYEVLETIDKAIPSPLFFVLDYGNKNKYVAAYKRPSEVDRSKWVVSGYSETEWINDGSERKELPVVLNMGALYHTLLKNIIPLPARKNEPINKLFLRMDQLRSIKRDASKLESRIRKEKQFNRKVELNSELKALELQIRGLE